MIIMKEILGRRWRQRTKLNLVMGNPQIMRYFSYREKPPGAIRSKEILEDRVTMLHTHLSRRGSWIINTVSHFYVKPRNIVADVRQLSYRETMVARD